MSSLSLNTGCDSFLRVAHAQASYLKLMASCLREYGRIHKCYHIQPYNPAWTIREILTERINYIVTNSHVGHETPQGARGLYSGNGEGRVLVPLWEISHPLYSEETSINSVRPSSTLRAVSVIWSHEGCKCMRRSLGLKPVVHPVYTTLYSMKIEKEFFDFTCLMQDRTDYSYKPSFSMM